MWLEVGVEIVVLDAEDAAVEATVLGLGADVVLGPEAAGGPAPYFHAGPRFLLDFAVSGGSAATERAAAVAFGVGLAGPGRGWDVRVSVDALLGSENVRAFAGVAAGVRF
jgi:hypothetical protein